MSFEITAAGVWSIGKWVLAIGGGFVSGLVVGFILTAKAMNPWR